MAEWKILITDGLKENGRRILEDTAAVDDQTGISAEDLKTIIPNYHAIIVRGRTKVTSDLIIEGNNLKAIGRAGVGVDNIDLAAAQAKQITVINSPMATTIAVAEHTLGLMLSMVREIPKADSAMKSGQWIKKQLVGSELNNKTLGIIGMGRIGAAVVERAGAFGMEILGYDPFLSADIIIERGTIPVDLTDIFKKSDIISLHLPLSSDTRNMINGQTIGLMKRGVCLICAARGGIIDETALLAALETGQIANAALDVFQDEPPGLTALVAHPNVISTPHIGAQTQEAQFRAAEDIATEILNALRGDPLRWKIV